MSRERFLVGKIFFLKYFNNSTKSSRLRLSKRLIIQALLKTLALQY